jgi:hypothetical protein
MRSWLWPDAPAERLAVLRILTGLFAFVYLVVRLRAFLALADADRSAFDPVGVLWFLHTPLPGSAVRDLLLVTLLLALGYTLGLGFRFSGPAFAIALLILTTYRNSFGQLLWFEALIVLHVLIVGFAPSGDALSVGRSAGTAVESQAYGAPVRLAAAVTVLTYVLSGIAKLRIGGLGWMSAGTLQNHIAYSAARLDVLGGTPSPWAPWLVGHRSLLAPLAVATVVLEVGAPAALFAGWVRTVWVGAIWLLHVGIAATLFVVFPYPLCGVAFAPFFRLERLAHIRATGRIARSNATNN